MSQSFILRMFVECLICVLGNRDEAVNKTDKNKENSLCEIGLSFSYLENGGLDIILLGVPRSCKGLWFVELSCECFLPIKPESVLLAPGGSWAGVLEPERQVGGRSWLLDSCCRLSWACQLAWPQPHSQPLGFPSSWPSPVTAQLSLCSLGTIPTHPVFPHCPPLTFWCGRILEYQTGFKCQHDHFLAV